MKHIYFFLLLSFSVFNSTAQSGQWVWIHGSSTPNDPGFFGPQGIPSQLNEPPGLYEVCEWKDHNGKFWFYGGLDDNAGIRIHNDLWKFDPDDSTWTWVYGTNTLNDHGYYGVQGIPSPSNHPPGLGYGVATWVDKNNNLWMFGGWDDSTYADMWKYDISTNIWTWMKGPGIGFANIAGVYGTQGVPDPANNPPGRSECAATCGIL